MRSLRKFVIQLSYFKPSGKWYANGHFEQVFHDLSETPRYHICNMNEVVEAVKLLNQKGFRRLPGLCDAEHQWDGFILVNCVDGHPVLILPVKE